MNNKEKVLMVHNFYQIGGGEHTVFENETALLRNHGHDVVTYTRDNAELKTSIIKKVLLPITSVFSLKTYREVRKIIKRDNIDIVHCHNTFPLISPSVYYAAWSCGTPVVQTIHNFRFLCPCGLFYHDGSICEDCGDGNFKYALEKKCYRNSKLQTLVVVNMLRIHRKLGTYKKLNYIFLTEFNKNKFDRLLDEHHHYQFIKPNFEEILDADSPKDRDKSGFAFIGRLDHYKGIEFILKAWQKENNRELYIFGDGELKDVVIEAEHQQHNIHYMGFQPREIILEHLKNVSALLVASEGYEGFPMILIEAFACGTPVVSIDLGNQADIVSRNGAGVLFKKHDTESFLAALNTIEKQECEFSRNARNAYINNYTSDINYKKLIEIYQKIQDR